MKHIYFGYLLLLRAPISTNAVDPKLNIGHGTYLDMLFTWDIKDIISQTDAEMAAAKG